MNNQSVNHESGDNCSHSTLNPGCGCNNASGIVITISPTTGGQFNLVVQVTDTVDHLKKVISKKLKVLRERICLLYRDRQLMNGSLQENDLSHGSRLTLLPAVETGLTTQRPELSVMNALESLNEAQVNDFLSGKAPLNLTMRLGDHMMLIQLMLSTFSNQSPVAVAAPKTEASAAAPPAEKKRREGPPPAAPTDAAKASTSSSVASSPRLERILSSVAADASSQPKDESDDSHGRENIKSAPSAWYDALPDEPPKSAENWSSSSSSSLSTASCSSSSSSPRLERILSSVAEACDEAKDEAVGGSRSPTGVDGEPPARWYVLRPPPTENSSSSRSSPTPSASAASSPSASTNCGSNSCAVSPKCATDSVPLAKATRNLTQTLQKLSSEVMTSKKMSTVQKYKGTSSSVMHFSKKPNAILENMEHHGRGIYSGTFSGTLNPALQDRFGRPKKDVSTIIHILNDLLCAEPRSQCRPSCTCRPTSPPTEKMETNVDKGSAVTPMEMSDDSPDLSDKMPSCSLASSPAVVAGTCDANVQSKRDENQMTRSKMEQLKSIMEERKEKRKEKRFSPYEKRFPSLNLISATTPVSRASAAAAAAAIHAPKSNDSLETETTSIHSKPVIA